MGWNAYNRRSLLNPPRDDSPCANRCIRSDMLTLQNGGVEADEYARPGRHTPSEAGTGANIAVVANAAIVIHARCVVDDDAPA
jgi:hypothetical protein